MNEFQLTKLDRQGVETLVDWARTEGWNPGPGDAGIFYDTDPDGFYGYFQDNQLIAGGAVVSYSGDFGFMGLFIVRPDFRMSGTGRRLWYARRDLLLSRLKPGAAIGMDGVVAMQPFYRKGGFETAFRDERYGRMGIPFPVHPDVSPVFPEDLTELLRYDRICFGCARDNFMTSWIRQPGSYAFKYTRNGSLSGFAVMRKAHQGYKTGPLFADSPEIADALYLACLNAGAGHHVYLDIPVNQPAAVELVRKYEAQYVFECARMYYGYPPVVPHRKIFGITTFELG